MNILTHADRMLLEAAEGWLMLGNPIEANEELEQIDPALRCHPSVLATRWQVYAAAQWWEAAWVVSKALCEMMPDCSEVWICQANTLRKYRGLKEATELLQSIVERFPGDPVIRYNMACYEAQLGNVDVSCQWLVKAFEMKDTTPLKLAAVYDPDLQPVWQKIGHNNLFAIEVHLPAAASLPQV